MSPRLPDVGATIAPGIHSNFLLLCWCVAVVVVVVAVVGTGGKWNKRQTRHPRELWMMRTGVRTAPTLSLPSNTLILLMAYFSFVAFPARGRRRRNVEYNQEPIRARCCRSHICNAKLVWKRIVASTWLQRYQELRTWGRDKYTQQVDTLSKLALGA